MSKVHAINTVCKHRLANELFYVDIGPRLLSTETVVSATVTLVRPQFLRRQPQSLTTKTNQLPLRLTLAYP